MGWSEYTLIMQYKHMCYRYLVRLGPASCVYVRHKWIEVTGIYNILSDFVLAICICLNHCNWHILDVLKCTQITLLKSH